jgi:hypothetical protein
MTEMAVQIKKIAGRGEGVQMNWGATVTRARSILTRQLKELKKHIGEIVVVTGGGGFGHKWAILKKVELVPYDKGMGLKAHLDRVTPNGGWGPKFEPWIDSWQINVLTDKKQEQELRTKLLAIPYKDFEKSYDALI